MPEYQVLRCYKCETFQAQQEKKVNKWTCVSCGAKQTTKKIYAQSPNPKDLRPVVQEFNMRRGQMEEEARQAALLNPKPSAPLFVPQAQIISDKPAPSHLKTSLTYKTESPSSPYSSQSHIVTKGNLESLEASPSMSPSALVIKPKSAWVSPFAKIREASKTDRS